jgi:hypothetical protein
MFSLQIYAIEDGLVCLIAKYRCYNLDHPSMKSKLFYLKTQFVPRSKHFLHSSLITVQNTTMSTTKIINKLKSRQHVSAAVGHHQALVY